MVINRLTLYIGAILAGIAAIFGYGYSQKRKGRDEAIDEANGRTMENMRQQREIEREADSADDDAIRDRMRDHWSR